MIMKVVVNAVLPIVKPKTIVVLREIRRNSQSWVLRSRWFRTLR